MKADEEARIAWAKENSNGHLPFRFVIVRPALNFQNVDVFRCYVHPLVVFLLLRAGQTDLVEKVWDQWCVDSTRRTSSLSMTVMRAWPATGRGHCSISYGMLTWLATTHALLPRPGSWLRHGVPSRPRPSAAV